MDFPFRALAQFVDWVEMEKPRVSRASGHRRILGTKKAALGGFCIFGTGINLRGLTALLRGAASLLRRPSRSPPMVRRIGGALHALSYSAGALSAGAHSGNCVREITL